MGEGVKRACDVKPPLLPSGLAVLPATGPGG
jgi:hypothetical protein